MRNAGLILLAVAVAFSISGCKKKQPTLEQMQEPLSMQELSNVGSQTQAVAPTQEMSSEGTVPGAITEIKPELNTAAITDTVAEMENLPPAGPYKPGAIEIQTALKNAGFYNGTVDGKIGPMTKKAIEEFQKANGLNPDGVVGPKTWQVLSRNLNAVLEAPSKKGTKKR